MKKFRYFLFISCIILFFLYLLILPVIASSRLWRFSVYSYNSSSTYTFCATQVSFYPNTATGTGVFPFVMRFYYPEATNGYNEMNADPSSLQILGICPISSSSPPNGVTSEDWNDTGNWDFDGDGVPNNKDSSPYGVDANGNGILDIFEQDANGDGVPDLFDPQYMGPRNCEDDADCDGVPNDEDPDYCDPATDADCDGVPNDQDPDYCDPNLDSDSDGISDCDEDDEDSDSECDSDGDGVPDDDDGDGIPDCEENDPCPYDGSKPGWFDGFVAFLPRSPESVRIPVIISRLASGNTLAANLLLIIWEGAYQVLLLVVLIKVYKLLPFV